MALNFWGKWILNQSSLLFTFMAILTSLTFISDQKSKTKSVPKSVKKMEHKNKWYKFGSYTWCYKHHSIVCGRDNQLFPPILVHKRWLNLPPFFFAVSSSFSYQKQIQVSTPLMVSTFQADCCHKDCLTKTLIIITWCLMCIFHREISWIKVRHEYMKAWNIELNDTQVFGMLFHRKL